MASNKNIDTDPNYASLTKLLRDMDGTYIKAGWFEKSGKDDRKDGSMITNSQLAIIHEYGAKKNGKKVIVERPFVRPSFDEHQEEYLDQINDAILSSLEAKDKNIFDDKIQKTGLKIKQDQQQKIREIQLPALKAATIKRKKSSKPLIDTAELLNSNDYEIGKN